MSDFEQKIFDAVSQAFQEVYNLETGPDVLTVEVPRDPKLGDYATGAAMKLAKTLHKSPMDIAAPIVDKLKDLSIDLVVMAGFMTIVTGELFAAYENAVINIHPALIPSFCGKGAYGLHVHEQALACGVKVSGATVHFVTEECDSGPIILQKAVDVLPDDTPEVLQRRIMEQCEWKLLPQAVSLFCQDRLRVEGRTVRILP